MATTVAARAAEVTQESDQSTFPLALGFATVTLEVTGRRQRPQHMRVQDVMAPAVTVRVDVTITDATMLLLRSGSRGLIAVDSAGKVSGVVFDGDLLSLQAMGTGAGDVVVRRVSEVARRPFISAEPTDDLQLCRRLLQHDVAIIPVVQEGRVVGQIGRRELLRALTRDDDHLRRMVTRHVRAGGCETAGESVKVRDGIVEMTLDLQTARGRRIARGVRRLQGVRHVIVAAEAATIGTAGQGPESPVSGTKVPTSER